MTSPWTASTLAYIHRWRCSMRCCKRSIDINQDIRLATLGMSCQWEIQDPKMYCTTEDFWWGYLHSSYTGLIQSSIIFYIHIYIYIHAVGASNLDPWIGQRSWGRHPQHQIHPNPQNYVKISAVGCFQDKKNTMQQNDRTGFVHTSPSIRCWPRTRCLLPYGRTRLVMEL